jgi:uracil-DNA glycosylase
MTNRIEPQHPINFNGLALIGESPGEEEIAQGLPFVGRSGKLLDTVLEELGIVRNDCLTTNVFLSRPTGNRIDEFFRSSTEADAEFVERYGLYRNRVVRDENRLDMERLDDELCRYRPRLILLLGATALWRVNRVNGITAARGSWTLLQPYGDDQSVGVLPTWHPSAVLRTRTEKLDQFVGDIKQIRDALDGLAA